MIPQPWASIIGAALIIVFFALFGEGASRLIRRLGKLAGLRETALGVIRDSVRAIWIVLAVVGVAYYIHVASELTVVAFSTVGGLIVSLALQATLSNVIAGLFLLGDGTLRLDDDITYSGVTGRVVRITLRTTWVMTNQGEIAAIANSQLMNGPLVNRTASTRLVNRYHLAENRTGQKSEPPTPPSA
jgi:small-conductance mechanosensitive channel